MTVQPGIISGKGAQHQRQTCGGSYRLGCHARHEPSGSPPCLQRSLRTDIIVYKGAMFRRMHRWIWGDAERRAHKLLRFGETETDGGRDLVRASEMTPDSLLRRLYLVHAADEHRHGVMFRQRGSEILRALPPG